MPHRHRRRTLRRLASGRAWLVCAGNPRVLLPCLALIGILLGAGICSRASAQSAYPNRPIRIIVPFAPGGSADVIARVLAGPLQELLKESIIVENRAGGGANIGTGAAARAEPDGYTLLLPTSAFVVNPSLYKSIPYDPFRDFAPIADLAVTPNVLAANPNVGIKDLADLIARAKAAPGKLNYSTAGKGTTPPLAMDLLQLRAGVKLTPVPYPGGGPATQAVLAGTTELTIGAMPNVQAHIRSGTLRGIAVASARRWPDLPDLPTFIESGLPDFTSETIHILLAPAGTPPEIVDRVANAAIAALRRPEIADKLTASGYAVVAGGPNVLKRRIAREVPFFKQLAEQTGLVPE